MKHRTTPPVIFIFSGALFRQEITKNNYVENMPDPDIIGFRTFLKNDVSSPETGALAIPGGIFAFRAGTLFNQRPPMRFYLNRKDFLFREATTGRDFSK
jgi:hypothetical protein